MDFLKYKTIFTGLGLIGLGIYQLTQSQFEAGMASIAAGLGLIFEGARPD
jgi:hypothetical protein